MTVDGCGDELYSNFVLVISVITYGYVIREISRSKIRDGRGIEEGKGVIILDLIVNTK